MCKVEIREITPAFVFVGSMLSHVQKMPSERFLDIFDPADDRGAHALHSDDNPLPLRQGISPGRLYELTPSSHYHKPGENKSITLRSWRKPQEIGGDCRKATAQRLARRLRQKRVVGKLIHGCVHLIG